MTHAYSRRFVVCRVAAGAAFLATAGLPTPAVARPPDVTDWIRRHARPLATDDPSAALHDLSSLAAVVRHAAVVGLGESTHGAREQFRLKHRAVRFLVERMGFRSIVLEEDWTKGIQIDEYLATGSGDLRGLLADAGMPWRCEEIMALVQWLRRYNESHPQDPVRFAGADVVAVRSLAYDAITAYVARVAPALGGELAGYWAVLRPPGGIQQHIQWLRAQPDKQRFVELARRARNLVGRLPMGDGLELVTQHARAIFGFYEYHATGQVPVRDRHMGHGVAWWQRYTGHRTVYWAASVHTAPGDPMVISYPDFPPSVGRSAGSHLREAFGRRYVSIGFTFDHGTVNSGFPLRPFDVPSPPEFFADHPLGRAGGGIYLLNLHVAGPSAVRDWLRRGTTVRMIGPTYDPARDSAYHMTGGTLAQWFDAIVHSQAVTPSRLIMPG